MIAAAVAFLILVPGSALAADPTWLPEQRVESGQTAIYGLSCPSVSTCIAAAGAGPVVQDSALPSQPATDPDPGHSLNAVSCAPGTKFCMFVDNAGGAFTYNDGTFGPRVSMNGTTQLDGVSCPTATFCMAIDHNHRVIKYSSGSWDGGTTLNVPGTFYPFVAVSCTSASFCAAVASQSSAGTYGTVAFTYNGVSWSSASPPFNTTTATQAYPISLSCTSSTHCLVTHEEGKLSAYNGASWSTYPSRIDTYNDHPRPFVSCVGATCMAVDFFDNWTRSTDGGLNWTPLVNFKSNGLASGMGGITSLACATAALCVAGDSLGQVTTFAVPPEPGTPSIAGSAFVGQTLSLTHGAVQTPGAWYSDRWLRCADPGFNCLQSPISTSPTSYTLVAEDTGNYVEARETFGFGFYSSSGASTNSIGPVCNGTCPAPDPATPGDTPVMPPGDSPTGEEGGTADTTVTARLGGRRKQRVLKRRTLVVTVSCGAEACDATTRGRLRGVPRKVRRLRQAKGSPPAGGRAKLVIRLSRKQLRKIRAALLANRRVRAIIFVTVVDGAGNHRAVKRAIRIVG